MDSANGQRGQQEEDENKDRGNWSGQLDFVLSLIGYAVGLGNVWRFPYLCYRNGGGAFLIPYAIMLVFVGIPLFYMELALGQFCSSGPLTCWQFAPIFKGIGFGQLVINSLVSIYYNMIIGWSLFYLFASFANITHLPWADCFNEWNTYLCVDRIPEVSCTNSTPQTAFANGTCYNGTELVGVWNETIFESVTHLKRTSASEEYYNRRVLRLSSGIDVMGPVMWDLALSLILAWFITFFALFKGIKTSGKIVYFTAVFPYVILIILFFRGITLPHAIDGIVFYLKPDFSQLAEPRVWNDAALQIFFAMSSCWGGLIALASFNRFHHQFRGETICVTLLNFFTGIFSGFAVFGFLGYLAWRMDTSVHDVVDSGPGLAFIVYPDSVLRLPLSSLWAILFFAMLLFIGLDTQFVSVECIVTSLVDQFAVLRSHKTVVTLAVCVVLCLLGLPLCTQGGGYLLQLMDTYSCGWGVFVIALAETLAIFWVYGARRFYDDIRIMVGQRPSTWWNVCLRYLTPFILLFLLLFSLVRHTPARYGSYIFPVWADLIGWMMSFVVAACVPIYAVFALCCLTNGSFLQRLRSLIRPTKYWGPALVEHRKLVDYVEHFAVDPWTDDDNTASSDSQTLAQAIDDNKAKRRYTEDDDGEHRDKATRD